MFIIQFNDVHKPLQFSKKIIHVDDSVIYTSSKDIAMIQRNLTEVINNLCRCWKETNWWSIWNSSGNELNISVNGTCINNTFIYMHLGVDLDPNLSFITSHFDKIHKNAAGRDTLLRSIR